jgi:hypothetical protein
MAEHWAKDNLAPKMRWIASIEQLTARSRPLQLWDFTRGLDLRWRERVFAGFSVDGEGVWPGLVTWQRPDVHPRRNERSSSRPLARAVSGQMGSHARHLWQRARAMERETGRRSST